MKGAGKGQETAAVWAVILYLNDQPPSYALGFEIGEISSEMKSSVPVIERVAMEENLQMIRLMANSHGYRLDIGMPEEGWVRVLMIKTLGGQDKERTRVNKDGLVTRPN